MAKSILILEMSLFIACETQIFSSLFAIKWKSLSLTWNRNRLNFKFKALTMKLNCFTFSCFFEFSSPWFVRLLSGLRRRRRRRRNVDIPSFLCLLLPYYLNGISARRHALFIDWIDFIGIYFMIWDCFLVVILLGWVLPSGWHEQFTTKSFKKNTAFQWNRLIR